MSEAEKKWVVEANRFAETILGEPPRDQSDTIVTGFHAGIKAYKEALRSAIEKRIAEWEKHPQMNDLHLSMIEELKEVLDLLDSVTPKE